MQLCRRLGDHGAARGAREALCVDSSEAALAVAQRNAAANGVASAVERGDAFEVLDELCARGERFDAVVLDPPAFIKRKKDIARGQAAYRKLNQLAMRLLERDALLVSCSCSYHLAADELVDADPGRGAPQQPLRAGAGQRRPVAGSSGASGDPRDALSEGLFLPRHARVSARQTGRMTAMLRLSAHQSDRLADSGRCSIHWYGIMYLVGFAAAWGLARRRAARPDSTWTRGDVDDFLFYAMLGVILGGRIGYVLFYGLPLWRADWLYPLKIWEGGMSFHGGLLGVLAAVDAVCAGSAAARIGDVFDFAAPLPGIGLFFGRIGNFINGELWGRPTDVPWAMLVPESARRAADCAPSLAAVRGRARRAGAVHASSGSTRAARGRATRPRAVPVCYSVARIAVEFVREPDVASAIWPSAG